MIQPEADAGVAIASASFVLRQALFCQYFVLPEFCTRYFPSFFPLCSGKIKFYLFILACYNEFIKDRRD